MGRQLAPRMVFVTLALVSSLFCSLSRGKSLLFRVHWVFLRTCREERFCGEAPALPVSRGTRDNQGGLPRRMQTHGRLLLPLRLTPGVVSCSKSTCLGLCLFSGDFFPFCTYFCSPLVIAQAEFAVG